MSTTLYRFYDADDVLLYVGISNNAYQRWQNHSYMKKWWPEVASAKFVSFATREEASVAEVQAIKNEQPKYNVQHNGKRSSFFDPFDEKDPLVPFDHQEFADWPEYIKLSWAINDFAHKMNSVEHQMPYQDWLRMMMVLANALGYSDGPHRDLHLSGYLYKHKEGCPASSERYAETGFDKELNPDVPRLLSPYKVEVTSTGGLLAWYRCYGCGIVGTCGWAPKPWKYL